MSERDDYGTTIWIDKATSKKIAELAKMFRRSKAGQIRWMLDQEINRLETESGDGKVILSSDCAE
jgi:hypothetical protein